MGEEQLMRSRWVKRLGPAIPRWYNVRMGKLPDVEMAGAYKVILGYADLIYIQDDIVNIVEFKVRDFRGAVGQLLSYRQDFYKTPEFAPYYSLPVLLRIVASRHDDSALLLAMNEGISYEFYNG